MNRQNCNYANTMYRTIQQDRMPCTNMRSTMCRDAEPSCRTQQPFGEKPSCRTQQPSGEKPSCRTQQPFYEKTSCRTPQQKPEVSVTCECQCACDCHVEGIEVPSGDPKRLLCFINEVSFAVDDVLLYLDTHPYDQDALQYFKIHNDARNRALEAYEKAFGPLVIAVADDSCSRSWEWMNQPWPWEGGRC